MAQQTKPAFTTPLFEQVSGIHTVFDAMQVLRKASTKYDLRYFSVISFPNGVSGAEQSIAQLSIISSWPRELIAEYDRLELARNNPVLNELQKKITPVLIDIEELNQGPPSQKRSAASELFKRFELTMGVSFPIHDGLGLRYAVCFLGERNPLSDEELSTLAMFSTMLIEQISRVTAVDPAAKSVLNARETEVLQWTAEGKTSSDIAKITGLSEHTVNHYAIIATQKLGCSNRTQAVVCAIRLGLFR